jgi:hypothetical protein
MQWQKVSDATPVLGTQARIHACCVAAALSSKPMEHVEALVNLRHLLPSLAARTKMAPFTNAQVITQNLERSQAIAKRTGGIRMSTGSRTESRLD